MSRHQTNFVVIARVIALVATLLPFRFAFAQSDDIVPSGDTWKFTVGLGAFSGPKFPGSSARRTSLVPLLSANNGRFFIGGLPGAGVPVGLGVNLLDQSNWKLGVGVGLDLRTPRRETDDPRLTGLGDIPSTPHGAVFGSYSQSWFTARANVRSDIGGHHEGTLVALELEARYAPLPDFVLSAGPGLTWADKRYAQTFFGISAAQSASSGLGGYDAGAGINDLRFSVGADYRISPRWFVGGRVTAGSLRGDARHSPVTSSTAQDTFGLFSGYRF